MAWRHAGSKAAAKRNRVDLLDSCAVGATTEDSKLVAKGGILEDELASGTAAEVSGASEWLRGGRKRGGPGPKAAGKSEDVRGDGGDVMKGSTPKEVAAPAP